MSTRPRTTAELIAGLEAEAEAGNFDVVCLAVGFEETAILIYSNQPDRLAALNSAIERGGEPIGFIAVQKQGSVGWSIGSKLLAEYKGEQWAREFIERLADSCGRTLSGRISQLKN